LETGIKVRDGLLLQRKNESIFVELELELSGVVKQEEIIQVIIAHNLLVVRIYAAIFYDAEIQDLVT